MGQPSKGVGACMHHVVRCCVLRCWGLGQPRGVASRERLHAERCAFVRAAGACVVTIGGFKFGGQMPPARKIAARAPAGAAPLVPLVLASRRQPHCYQAVTPGGFGSGSAGPFCAPFPAL